MGQKINPISYRLPALGMPGYQSRWFTTKPQRYIKYLMSDVKLREGLMKRLAGAGVTKIEIERSLRNIRVIIHVTRPGIVIGRGGSGLEELKKFIYKILEVRADDKGAPKIDMQVEEVKQPDTSAHLVATRISEQLLKRVAARRAVTKAMERTMSAGAGGIKVLVAGRVGGAEIARREMYHQGSVPLQTIRANIEYAQVPCLTRSGYVGIKVWIYKGEKS